MFKYHNNIVSALLLLIGVSSDLHGQERQQDSLTDFDALLTLPLEELASLTVTVSSHKPEHIVETPAIISRYEVREMARIGLRTLQDILSFIPGITVQEHLFGQPFVSMRGIYEGFNQKVLFLLDDTPYFMPSHSDMPILGIPIEAISHIEVIRGPGAVFYGSNATAGVIKVVTRKDNASSVSIRGGENSFVNGGGFFNSGDRDWGQLSAAVEIQRDDGYQAAYPAYNSNGENFAQGRIDKKQETSSALLNYQRKGFKAQAHVFETLYTGIAEPRQPGNRNDLIYKGYLFGLRNDWKTDVSTISVFTDYNNFYPRFEIDNFINNAEKGGFRFDNDGRDNYRWRSGLTFSRKLSKDLELFLGVEHEQRSTEDYQVFNGITGGATGSIYKDFDLTENSIYGQLDFRPLRQWRFIFGGRYTGNSITGSDIVPRFSTIYQIDEKQSVKLLYSVGFNAPSFTQLKADVPPFVAGNENLKSEKVKSLDLAYTYTTDRLLFVANAWQLHADEFIMNEVVNGTKQFFNAGTFSREGIELDFQYTPAPEIRIYSNLTYYREGNSGSATDTSRFFVPEWTLNIGGYYQFNMRNTAGLSVRYIDERSSANSLWLANLDYQYRWRRLQLYATLENLLDEKILHPNMGELSDRLVPGGQNRNIKIGTRYFF